MGIIKPSFFIVGAPKCGTTSLNEYLKEHPDIFIPEKKEIHYFGSDLSNSRYVRNVLGYNEDKYLEHFKTEKNYLISGEASVYYLFSKRAPSEICQFNNKAKIIIMLRNPVEMLPSLHSQNLYGRDENISDFKSALNLEEVRKQGEKIPKTNRNRESLYYKEVASYAEQVKRYINVFGRENVHIIKFDEFKSQTDKVYKNVLKFLNVDDSYSPSYQVANPNKARKNYLISDFIIFLNRKAKSLVLVLIPVKSLRRKLLYSVRKINVSYGKRNEIPKELKFQLAEYFKSEIDKLEYVTGISFNEWRKTN